MKQVTTYVGVDAHKKDLFIAMLVGTSQRPVTWTVPNEPNAVKRLVRKLEREAPAAEIARAVAKEYGWPSPHPVERTLGTANPGDYAGFAGIYEVPTRSPPVVLAIEADGGKLYRVVNDARAELLAENPTTFFATDSDLRIEFLRDTSGRVTEARVWQGGIERKALRR